MSLHGKGWLGKSCRPRGVGGAPVIKSDILVWKDAGGPVLPRDVGNGKGEQDRVATFKSVNVQGRRRVETGGKRVSGHLILGRKETEVGSLFLFRGEGGRLRILDYLGTVQGEKGRNWKKGPILRPVTLSTCRKEGGVLGGGVRGGTETEKSWKNLSSHTNARLVR